MNPKKGKQREVKPEAVTPEPELPQEPEPETHTDENTDEEDEDPNLDSDDSNTKRIEQSIAWENFLRSSPRSPREPKKKAYCVFHGRTVGVFETWPATQAQCSGFPGARYKGYTSLATANAGWEHALAIGAVPSLKSPPGEKTSTSTSNSTADPSMPRQSAGHSTSQTSDPANPTLVSPGGPSVACYVVVCGDYPGVYHTNDAAVNAMGDDPRAHRIQVASMQEGDAVFREEYMAGNVVSLKNAPT